MNCHKCFEIIAEAALGVPEDVPLADRRAAREHMRACSACRQEFRRLRRIEKALRPREQPEFSREVLDRVHDNVMRRIRAIDLRSRARRDIADPGRPGASPGHGPGTDRKRHTRPAFGSLGADLRVRELEDALRAAARQDPGSMAYDQAFSAYVRHTETALLHAARRVTGCDHAARDVLQEGYVVLHRRLLDGVSHRRSPIVSLTAWLTRVVVNSARQDRREAGRRKPVTFEEHHAESRERAQERRMEPPQGFRDLRERIARLPQLQRRVFVFRAVESMTYTEIARILGITPQTACSCYHRARRKLGPVR